MLPHLTRKLLTKIALWSLLWLVVIGGVGALFNYAYIRDDRRRADLAQRGLRTVGILSSEDKLAGMRHVRRCGKETHAIVQFIPANKKLRRICVGDGLPPEYRRYLSSRRLPDARVGVAYDPKDPSHFFVMSADGTLPRRDLEGIWRRWFKRTMIMLAIYGIGTAFVLWRRARTVDA